LKGDHSSKINCSVVAFQFQSGAIERGLCQAPKLPANRFQFQSGAIERGPLAECSGELYVFQFQSGAIESTTEISFVPNPPGFNSNLVRLKAHSDCFGADAVSVSIPIWCD